jgi:hypothetical protein
VNGEFCAAYRAQSRVRHGYCSYNQSLGPQATMPGLEVSQYLWRAEITIAKVIVIVMMINDHQCV